MAKIAVAPLVGAWIEINELGVVHAKAAVAPLVGAWIEILNNSHAIDSDTVAPLVGAWIEIDTSDAHSPLKSCRSPRGSVD